MKMGTVILGVVWILSLAAVSSAESAIIRLDPSGLVLSYASTADFVANTNFIVLGATPFGGDLGYYVDPASGAIIRVAGSGIVLSYPLIADFVSNSNYTALGTTPFGGDLGYYVDPASGAIIRVAGSGIVLSYPSVGDFVSNSNFTALGTTPFGGDLGYYVDPASGAIIRVAGSGIVLSYPSVGDFVSNSNFTALGTTPFGGNLGFFVVAPPPAGIIAGPVTNPATGSNYYLLDVASWTESEKMAVSLGGHLVTIDNAAENEWVLATFGSVGGVDRTLWVGLTDAVSEGGFGWVSGEMNAYTNWGLGEPSGAGPRNDFGAMAPPDSGTAETWFDAVDAQPYYGVVEVRFGGMCQLGHATGGSSC